MNKCDAVTFRTAVSSLFSLQFKLLKTDNYHLPMFLHPIIWLYIAKHLLRLTENCQIRIGILVNKDDAGISSFNCVMSL